MTSDERNRGGGTGGGAGMDDDGNNLQSASATYQIAGNQVVLLSRKAMPPGKQGPSRIVILAAGALPACAEDGNVDVRGSQGVRITSGPALPPLLPATSAATNGIEILTASEAQNITIKQGTTPVSPSIELNLGGIVIDGGHTQVNIKSLVSISLSVAGGTSQILLTPTGIVIKGPIVAIN